MVFNSNLPTRLQFRVAVQDRFAQKAIEVYRGFIQLFTDASQACQATQARKTPDDSRVPPRLNSQTSFKVQSSHCLHHIVLCTLESLVTAAEDVRFFSSCLAAALLEMLWLTFSSISGFIGSQVVIFVCLRYCQTTSISFTSTYVNFFWGECTIHTLRTDDFIFSAIKISLPKMMISTL